MGRQLRAVPLALVGVAFSWAILTLSGARHFLDRLTLKWHLGWYHPAFLVLLALAAAIYFSWQHREALAKDMAIGALAGIFAGVVAVFFSAWLQFGVDGFARGISAGGASYLLVLVGVVFFPFCGWLYGALALGCGGLVGRYLFPLLGRSHPSRQG